MTTDLREAADLRRADHSFACPSCGSPEPARIEAGVCSECSDFPRCANCGRWVSDGSGWLPGYVNVLDGTDEVRVCQPCWDEVR